MYNKIDIGNVRGIQGEKGEKGDRGKTPSYDDIRYAKQGDDFVTLKGTGEIIQSEYYLDINGNLCNSEGYIYDETGVLTDEVGEPFDISIYGYEYKPLWIDSEGRYTNNKGELLDENWNVQYVLSDFISDVASYIFADDEGYDKLVTDISPHVVDTLISANPNDEKYRDFFDEIEGDIKYFICADNPKTSIYINNNELVNTCKYYDENGSIVRDNNDNPSYVLLEKNTLYLYNQTGFDDNDVMHYDVYLCTKAGTVPKKIISSADFTIDYNVIDDFKLTTTDVDNDDENEVWLNLLTRGTRGQFYSMSDVDTLFENNVISKLGANEGIAQLNSGGKVPSSQLPAYIDDVVEGTMNSSETTFTPSDNDYIDSVKQKGKIYVDISSKKTYRWTGSDYVFISNPIVVDDGSTEAYASLSGSALESLIGNSTLNTTSKTVTGAINEHESDISSLNSNKQDKSDNSLNTTSKTVTGAINELNNDKVTKITGKSLSTEDFTTALKSKLENDVLTEHQDISMKADKSEIPTKTSDLTNDSQYVNHTTLNSAVNGLGNYLGGRISNLETLTIVKSTNGDYFLGVGGTQKGKTIVIPKNTSDLTNDSGFLTQHQDISGKEDVSNKVTSLNSTSTNTQYPSAKAVYDAIPSETITFTATLEDGTTKTYTILGYEEQETTNNNG